MHGNEMGVPLFLYKQSQSQTNSILCIYHWITCWRSYEEHMCDAHCNNVCVETHPPSSLSLLFQSCRSFTRTRCPTKECLLCNDSRSLQALPSTLRPQHKHGFPIKLAYTMKTKSHWYNRDQVWSIILMRLHSRYW